ncbi:acetyl-CoA synthetase-like protein [Delitschia confertaspora ATCC 74209]|uniref:Acetyl-CoA synthetase-like protein n=1 Tax=Delitschia confertaspora ATCC 74209 TaxID=1513339 RepID=A0A9P4MW37_9PLEO|nr:acetyl-CoA synthetase-like protein [Delitschia confertaspora ATCC 74209]
MRRTSYTPVDATVISPLRLVVSSTSIADIVLQHVTRLLDVSSSSIDRNSSFVNLGGHSILAVKLSSACKKDGINLPIINILLSNTLTELCASATLLSLKPPQSPCSPTSPRTPTFRRKSIQHNRRQSIQLQGVRRQSVLLQEARRQSIQELIDRPTQNDVFPASTPMTEMQLSFVHSYKKNPGTNIVNLYETYNTRDVPAVKAAWQTVIESEPIFRASFDAETLSVHENPSAPFRWNDIVCKSEHQYQSQLDLDVAPEDIEFSFDCVSYAGKSTIIWRVHHIFVDGQSAQLIYAKLRRVLMGLPIHAGTHFSSVAAGVRELQQSSHSSNQVFWKQQAENHPQPIGELALAEPSVPSSSAPIEQISFMIPIEKITLAARRAGVSLAAWYQAAWAMALSLYTDSDSVVFGSVLSGRNLPVAGAEDTIGPLINTLPFHISIDRKQTEVEYLKSIFAHSVMLQSIQYSTPEDGFNRNFATALAFEFDLDAGAEDTFRPVKAPWFRVIPDMPLSVFMSEKGVLRLCYKPSRYEKTDMQLLADHFRRAILLLRSSGRTMDDRMTKLLTAETRNTLMSYGNCNSSSTSLSAVQDDFVTLFEKAVRQNPEAIAIEKGDVVVTYAELDRKAGVFAKNLRAYVQPGEVVCVHADRSINWIVAYYGILKAGAAFSASDAVLPHHIRNMNFETAGAKVYIVPDESQKSAQPDASSFCFSVDELIPNDSNAERIPHRSTPRPEDTAYVCFTSGTTGRPKGVICHHAGLVALQSDREARLLAGPGERIAQFLSPAFDGSILEIFSALSYGATLVLTDGVDPFSQLRRATTAMLTPSVARVLEPSDFHNLKAVYFGGEPVPPQVNDKWSKEMPTYNQYGPTEASCASTIQRLQPGQRVAIGPPNPTTRVYILDRNQQLVPPGVVGEIYCAGVQVSRGYIGQPELTADKFLPDTICKRPGEMMYRTGDRAFFNHRGEVECLGRTDRQIKLRGFRTDLNDIEARAAGAVKEASAVVICPKDDYLVCMVQPATLDIADVRSKLTKVLPVHAVPRVIMAASKFPITSSGKLDYKEIARLCSDSSQPILETAKPLSATENSVAQVWRRLLALDSSQEVTGASNFAELGGHSVLQLRLASELSNIFKARIPMAQVIKAASLSEMASVIDQIRGQTRGTTTAQLKPLGTNNVAPIEAEWFEKYQIQEGVTSFNVTFACTIAPHIDLEHLTACWNAMLARHQIFRSRYHRDECRKEGVKRTYSKINSQVIRVDDFDLWEECNRPFDVERQNPIDVLISKSTMLLRMSHIIADLTAVQAMMKELMQMYNGSGLGPVKRRYADTVNWSVPATADQKQWWTDYLKGSKDTPNIISNLPKRTTYKGESRVTKFPLALAQQVLKYSTENSVTLHQMGLAAVALALQTENDSTDIVLGGPWFNRQAEDVETVGLFLEAIPIRIRYNHNQEQSFIKSVQSSSQSALSNGISWNQVLQAMGYTSDNRPEYPNNPVLDTVVTFHDDRKSPKLPIDGLDPLYTYGHGAKFALMVEFTALTDESVIVRCEYDDAIISKAMITKIEDLILESLRSIADGMEYGAIKERLRNLKCGETEKCRENVFGKALAAL